MASTAAAQATQTTGSSAVSRYKNASTIASAASFGKSIVSSENR